VRVVGWFADTQYARSTASTRGVRVAGERWSKGTVQRYDGDQVTVLFYERAYRDLLVPLLLERGLPQPRQARIAAR
jgi:hypothetical protein